ncbi:MAG: hypothetical protein HYZ72_19790 [Deltaproteobacteria bacterium]|nr:hypothetical protein [Deltaproteobacteria bacterium]
MFYGQKMATRRSASPIARRARRDFFFSYFHAPCAERRGARRGCPVALSASTAAAQSPQPKRIVWTGEAHDESRGAYRHFTVFRRFRYVQVIDASGRTRWVSRLLKWEATGKGESRWGDSTFYVITCKGSSGIELGPANNVSDLTEAQRKQLQVPCETKDVTGAQAHVMGPDPDPIPGPSQIEPPNVVGWEKLRDNCSYSKDWSDGGGHHTYSVSALPEIDAVMDVKTDDRSEYWHFVPKPRGKVSFSVRSNFPVRFHFTLKEVSRFPGYATNANIDDAFFWRYTLEHLKGKYKNDDPDLVFDPEDFEDREVWKKATKDTVETVKELKSISLPVTAMDFGAYGRLKVEAKAKCGATQPVKILVGGQEQDSVTIPMDQDNNLIADRMDKPHNGKTEWGYKGDPGRDDDDTPKGDGAPGDGFTVFEEYRGFVSSGGQCSDPVKRVIPAGPNQERSLHRLSPQSGRWNLRGS